MVSKQKEPDEPSAEEIEEREKFLDDLVVFHEKRGYDIY
jgi:hypothetical protein